jgi:hypothetical protein
LGLRVLSWVAVVQGEYKEALVFSQRSIEHSEGMPHLKQEWGAWSWASLSLAYFNLGQCDEARHVLYEALQTCVEMRAFLPLMHLMPILPVVLAENAAVHLKARAVELYAMAESLPFVGNSQLFADLAGKSMAAVAETLPPEVAAAARARGRQLDWWETAEILLEELSQLGWNGS